MQSHSPALSEIEVVIPNLHWRYSGVTATNRAVAPRLAQLFSAVWFGRDAPEGIRRIGWRDMLSLRALRFKKQRTIIWHARRNNEMIAGLVLRWLGWPFFLVFTSAAQRHHTWLTRFLIRNMDGLIATTDAAASFLQRRAVVIEHGVDTERYCPPPDRAAAWRESGLSGAVGIGCFGRVRHQKGTDVFIAAMVRLLPEFKDYTAVLSGAITPDQRAFAQGLQDDAEQAGLGDRIVFLGERPIDEIPEWYRRISLYAFTSRNEGFGLTLLEAMASGNAVVAARAGAAERVIVDGETGVLVPPGDVAALVQACETLMRAPDKIRAMGERARAHVQAHFSIEAEAERIADVYRTVWADPALR